MLALVVALSFYLRNVSSNTQDAYEKILNEPDRPTWKAGAEHTAKRKAVLRRTRATIEWITPGMFCFAVIIGAHVSVSAFPGAQNHPSLVLALRWIDLGLILALTAAIGGMWFSHASLKVDEIAAREAMYADLKEPPERDPPFKRLWARAFRRTAPRVVEHHMTERE